ncbi:hypothetical protein LTR50_006275 [Elasticomyces elasticus]|nr:hypothetical protein LTR50_006275 [Elasticomyces elasticus]
MSTRNIASEKSTHTDANMEADKPASNGQQLSGVRGNKHIPNSNTIFLRQTPIEETESELSSIAPTEFDDIFPSDGSGASSSRHRSAYKPYRSSNSAEITGPSSVSSTSYADEGEKHLRCFASTPVLRQQSYHRPKSTLSQASSVPTCDSQPARQTTSEQPSDVSPSVFPFTRTLTPRRAKTKTHVLGPQTEISLRSAKRFKAELRAEASIPTGLTWEEYGRQCVLAAQSSRLNPYALHPGEYRILRDHITKPQVTIYLNIRNGIVRLWTRNPLVSVSYKEALETAKHSRYFDIAGLAYLWLVRNGYINFGCVEVPKNVSPIPRAKRTGKQKTIVVVGGGVAGLGCARQLEGLFAQLGNHWTEKGEQPPKVIVLEGRQRIGGRVYSLRFRSQVQGSLPDELRNTAEMGAMIVTGFDRGNPMNILMRGQLGLHYHFLRDKVTLYDKDGSKIPTDRDELIDLLYKDIEARTGEYRCEVPPPITLEGDIDSVNICRDPPDEVAPVISTLEKAGIPVAMPDKTQPTVAIGTQKRAPAGLEKLTGRANKNNKTSRKSAAQAALNMGFEVREGTPRQLSLSLDSVAKSSPEVSFGEVMDEAIKQYQNLVEITPQDMRMLSWHHANAEYANAATVDQLSLSGWDQDGGNEFEGAHSTVVGGYSQVPRALWRLPTPLDVRRKAVVKSITYAADGPDGSRAASIQCENGETIEADEVVLTAPLGVLKAGSIDFQPPLPEWKRGAIDRMGFGLLNKVVLLYDKPFWNESRDMFGLLNDDLGGESLDPCDYASNRGRFYLIWNCTKTSGRPMLIALMAGNAAHHAETTPTIELVTEITARLSKVFAPQLVPAPLEAVVTRWKCDPFSRGTYSFVGPRTQADDYDLMAASVGNLHFAGEATCGTHPATVHGAYLSGLRAASEVIESLLGPIEVPQPLVEAPSIRPVLKHEHPVVTPLADIPMAAVGKATALPRPPKAPTQNEHYEAGIIGAILSAIGDPPIKPARPGVNPFIEYTKAHWNECKAKCEAARAAGSSPAQDAKNEVRRAVGKMWKNASNDSKRPYLEQAQQAQELADAQVAEYQKKSVEWKVNAQMIREEYMRNNPSPSRTNGQGFTGTTAIERGSCLRRERAVANYAELSDEG